MEQQHPTPPTSRKRSIVANLKGILFTLVVLAALWFGLRYVLTPLVLGDQPHEMPAASSSVNELPESLSARLANIEERLTVLENATLAADLKTLSARVEALESAPPGEAGAPVAVMSVDGAELARLKEDIARLKAADQDMVRSIILAGQIQDAIRLGRPFASELAALMALRPDLVKPLTDAESYASTGVATLQQLQQQFDQAIHPALESAQEKESMLDNLRSLVKIRKTGETQKGDDDEAIIARAEAKLSRGDVAAALSEIETLSPQGAAIFIRWKERADAYLSAQAVADTLQALIARSQMEPITEPEAEAQ